VPICIIRHMPPTYAGMSPSPAPPPATEWCPNQLGPNCIRIARVPKADAHRAGNLASSTRGREIGDPLFVAIQGGLLR
jgi:hypothetical protein